MDDLGKRILLIEDDPGDVLLLQQALAAQGSSEFSLTTVRYLAEGLQLLSMESFLAVLLDLSLPDSQGLETLLQLRNTHPDTPVVVLTGLCDGILALRAVQEGAQDYLIKGEVQPDVLVRALRYAIERMRLQVKQAKLIADLQQALEHVKTLKGLIPICAWCKKIRDDSGYWQEIEAYLSQHSDADFTHGMCPGCVQKTYSDFDALMQARCDSGPPSESLGDLPFEP